MQTLFKHYIMHSYCQWRLFNNNMYATIMLAITLLQHTITFISLYNESLPLLLYFLHDHLNVIIGSSMLVCLSTCIPRVTCSVLYIDYCYDFVCNTSDLVRIIS